MLCCAVLVLCLFERFKLLLCIFQASIKQQKAFPTASKGQASELPKRIL